MIRKVSALNGLPLYSIFKLKEGDGKMYQKCEYGCWVFSQHPKRAEYFRVGERLSFDEKMQVVFVMDFVIEVPHHDDLVKAIEEGLL